MSEKPSYKQLLEKVRFLEQWSSELKRTCRIHQKSTLLLNAIRMAQSLYIVESEPGEIYRQLLRSLVEITESEYGFLDEVFFDENDKVYKKNLAISDISWDEESRKLYKMLRDRDLNFYYLDNLSGLPALTGKTVISNDPANDERSRGLPQGHPPVDSFLGMPVFFGGRLVCVAGVANRKGGYDREIPDFLAPLLSTCGSITHALRQEAREKENKRKLVESEAKYRLIVENQNDLVLRFDREKRILFASPSYCRAFGIEETEILHRQFFPLIHEDDVETVKRSIATLEKPPHETYHEERAKTVDGWRWFGWSLKALLDDKGEVAEVVSVGRDITARKKPNGRSKNHSRSFKLSRTTRTTGDLERPDGRFVYVSPSCKRITGYGPDEFAEDPGLMNAIIHPEDLPMVLEHKREAEEKSVPHETEFRIRTRQGEEKWIGHVCQSVCDSDGRYLGKRGSNRDITEQKRLQRESIDAHIMQAIGTLAGGVAHRFNNALAVIMGNLELLEEDFFRDEIVERYAADMKASAEHMSRLTSQLLAYARGGKYHPVVLSLRDLVEEALPIIHYEGECGIDIHTEFIDEDLMVQADQPQIQMTLSAVLANAFEAMDAEGLVEIKVQRATVENHVGRKKAGLRPGNYACLIVKDSGRGMDEKTLGRIFEPFFTTKFQGRGLGMAAAFGIVKNHGGTVTVESRPGKGTSVLIYLPLVESTEERKAEVK